jgi:hypothetical protein
MLSISNDYLSNFHVALEQESALVTATINGKVSGNENSFVYSTASKSASSGVLKDQCRSNTGVSGG